MLRDWNYRLKQKFTKIGKGSGQPFSISCKLAENDPYIKTIFSLNSIYSVNKTCVSIQTTCKTYTSSPKPINYCFSHSLDCARSINPTKIYNVIRNSPGVPTDRPILEPEPEPEPCRTALQHTPITFPWIMQANPERRGNEPAIRLPCQGNKLCPNQATTP